jgi:CHASE2 domain-containing sensor protein
MEKIKIEIDLLRDTLRNIFVVMFAIISSIVGLIYKMFLEFNYIDLFAVLLGLIVFVYIGKLRIDKLKEINEKLKEI